MPRKPIVGLASGFFDRFVGSRTAEKVGNSLTGRALRILAYHGVDDETKFSTQMEHLRTHYAPVSADEVLESLEGKPLPPRAVWVTFDDGYPSVLDVGLPIVSRYEIPTTLFVCPAVIDTTSPLWWQSVELSMSIPDLPMPPSLSEAGRDPDRVIQVLKRLPDSLRRAAVANLAESARRSGADIFMPQLGSTAFPRLEAAGATIGNHTWDHPTLDTCDSEEQAQQITQAHEYLGRWPSLFRPVLAYPNGNHTAQAEQVATALGYRIGLLFDHLLTNTSGPRLSWSRLRVGSATPIARYRAILSGIHPLIHRLRVPG